MLLLSSPLVVADSLGISRHVREPDVTTWLWTLTHTAHKHDLGAPKNHVIKSPRCRRHRTPKPPTVKAAPCAHMTPYRGHPSILVCCTAVVPAVTGSHLHAICVCRFACACAWSTLLTRVQLLPLFVGLGAAVGCGSLPVCPWCNGPQSLLSIQQLDRYRSKGDGMSTLG